MTLLCGEVSQNAHETANCTWIVLPAWPELAKGRIVVLRNIFSSLLKDTLSNDAKKLMIDRFFYAVMVIVSYPDGLLI